MPKEIKIHKDLMSANNIWAGKIRDFLKEKNIKMINIIGSPGSGKTSLLECIFELNNSTLKFAVLEGDVETTNDAERINKYNIPVSQLITSGGCHLEARHIFEAVNDFDLERTNFIIVENVGNLVCPAEFDIGEHAKVAVLSITEGEDKPVKYPLLFRAAKAVVLSKIDLLPHLHFDLGKCINYIKRINSKIPIFKLSSEKKIGVQEFIDWLEIL